MQDIFIKGAKTHNLKNIDLHIPRKKLIVVTGVSGSGKSSLSIDTLYAEGQRKYIESLSSYARQFLSRMNKPDVEYIKGLCPAIAIEQKVAGGSNRSTVGTMTEIFDYLRLFFARVGVTYSAVSGKKVKKDDVSDVINYIKDQKIGHKGFVTCHLKMEKDLEGQFNLLINKGYSRLWVDGEFFKIEDLLEKDLKNFKKHKSFYNVIQRFEIQENQDEDFFNQLADSIQTAFEENHFECSLVNMDTKESVSFNNRFEADGVLYEVPSPQFFNFNNSFGACKTCEGMGNVLGIDEDLVIPDKTRSLYEEAVGCWKGVRMKEFQKAFIAQAAQNKFPIHRPYMDLSESEKELLWHGNSKTDGIDQFFKMVTENLYRIEYRILYSRYRGKTKCPDCLGSRIRKDAQYVKIGGKSIVDLMNKPIVEVKAFLIP